MLRKLLMTRPIRKPVRRANLGFEICEDRLVPSTVVFQQGKPLNLDGIDVPSTTYVGTQDAEITSEATNANSNFGQAISISIDQQDPLGVRQALLRFDDIFGNASGQIPLGSKINSAKLEFWGVSSTNTESFCSFNRMLVPWTQDSVTWNSFPNVSGGVQFDGIEAEELPDGVLANDINHARRVRKLCPVCESSPTRVRKSTDRCDRCFFRAVCKCLITVFISDFVSDSDSFSEGSDSQKIHKILFSLTLG